MGDQAKPVSPELDEATDQIVELMRRIAPQIGSAPTDVAAWTLMHILIAYPTLAAELDRLRALHQEHHATHIAN